MSAAPTQPPVTQKPAPPAVTVAATPTSGFGVIGWVLALIPLALFVAFHVGAGYLSYQKFGSMGWAILDFIFAYFYYPYYAFYLSGPSSSPEPVAAMMGGLRKLWGSRRR